MAAIRGHFRRGTDPYFFLFCYQLAIYQVSCFYHKVHNSSQNCYISAPLLLLIFTKESEENGHFFPYISLLNCPFTI